MRVRFIISLVFKEGSGKRDKETRRSGDKGTGRMEDLETKRFEFFVSLSPPPLVSLSSIPYSQLPTLTLARHDRLFLIVESDLLAGLQGGDRHAQRDGMVVGGVDVSVRFLVAVANALHPVAHMRHRLIIRSGVGRGLNAAFIRQGEWL